MTEKDDIALTKILKERDDRSGAAPGPSTMESVTAPGPQEKATIEAVTAPGPSTSRTPAKTTAPGTTARELAQEERGMAAIEELIAELKEPTDEPSKTRAKIAVDKINEKLAMLQLGWKASIMPRCRAGCECPEQILRGQQFAQEERREKEDENEPNALCPLEYEESDNELNAADDDEGVVVEVAMDSGAVANCASPKDLPRSVRVTVPTHRKLRNFVGAGGEGIKNHGESTVTLEQEDGFAPVNSTFQVTDVVRPLHSVGEICDGETVYEHEVLFTSGECTVVPAGTLSKFLGQIKQQAKYKRKGKGLYLARMYARKPKNMPDKAKPAGFGRQGSKA